MTASECCNDNRFELIIKYKQKLIEATNIETNEDEMAVIDNIIFRLWQMGWLDLMEKQEQGLIIELPVPLGTPFYTIHFYKEWRIDTEQFTLFDISVLEDWGKTAFASREEAEARLKELRGDRNV